MELILRGVAAASTCVSALVSTRHHANIIQHPFKDCHTFLEYAAAYWKLDDLSFLAVNAAGALIFVAVLSGAVFVISAVMHARKLMRGRKGGQPPLASKDIGTGRPRRGRTGTRRTRRQKKVTSAVPVA